MEENKMHAGQCPLDQELVPTYLAKCSYFWPEFFDKGAFVYSEVRFCEFQRELEADTQEAAEEIVATMNQEMACPLCGKRGKFRAMTNFDLINEKRILDGIVNNSLNGR